MLSRLTPNERYPFIVWKWYPSKYHCLWLPNTETPRMAPWFPPAFSLMAGVIAWILGPKSILYIVPLFGIMAGLAIAAIARQLIRHKWSGEIAFWFYTTLPLFVWHARFPRPEIIASYFVWGGIALLLHVLQSERWKRPWTIVLAALCMTAAPFMHMMAATVLLPAILLVLLILLAGRDDFILFLLIGLGMFILLVLQTLYICDTYRVIRYIAPILHRLPLFVLLGAGALIALTFVSVAVAKRRSRKKLSAPTNENGPRMAQWTCIALAITLPIAYLVGYALAARTDPAFLKRGIFWLVHRTDFNAVANMISRLVCLLGLLGLVALAALQRSRPILRIVFLACAVPATFVIGNMYDFFMTRYIILAIVPLLAISLAALVTSIPSDWKRGSMALIVVIAIVSGLGLRQRTHLISVREFKGFARYIGDIAEKINEQNGMALVEYNRIAAPFDLMYGVPTLALENSRIRNYRPAEKAWTKVMRRQPERPAYFITPYDREPASPFFRFRLVGEFPYTGHQMLSRRWDLPKDVDVSQFNLHMYEMTLPEKGDPGPGAALPYSASFGQGNVGLRRFEHPEPADNVWVEGVDIEPFRPITINPPRGMPKKDGQLWLLVISDDQPEWEIKADDGLVKGSWSHLADAWWLFRTDIDPSLRKAREIKITASRPLLLVLGRCVSPKAIVSVFDGWNAENRTQKRVPPFESRWAHSGARTMLPITVSGPDQRYVLAFFVAPHEYGETADVSFSRSNGPAVSQTVPTGRYIWGLWPLGAQKNFGAAECITVRNAACTEEMRADNTDIAAGIGRMIILGDQQP